MKKSSTLKKRKDFVKVAHSGVKAVRKTLVLQAAFRDLNSKLSGTKIGFIATKKLGKAHVRVLAKRRLRAAADIALIPKAKTNINYVIVARFVTAKAKFATIVKDLESALIEIEEQLANEKNFNSND